MAMIESPPLTALQHLNDRPQQSSQHVDPKDNDIYRMMVLRFENGLTEDDVDQEFLQMALDLGINVPRDPKTTLDIITNNVSTLSLTSAPSDTQPPPSRNSQSTHPPSDSSSEQRPTKNSSLATTSLTSATSSLHSASSSKSSHTKIKRGLRRISAMRRRKTIDSPIPALPFAVHTMQAISPATPIESAVQQRSMSQESLPVRTLSRTAPVHQLPDSPPRIRPIPQTMFEEQYLDKLAARHRSMNSSLLKRLRASQLEEQTRFIRFQEDQYRLMQFKQDDRKRSLLDRFTEQEEAKQDRQPNALVELEHRHLSAEVDLIKTLKLERQGCDTRLRHMQAYCNPRSTIEGMPSRVVTKKDYHLLEQQYHTRNGMDNLHKARINVLREKQGKQLERISAKQEAELVALAEDYRKQMIELEASSQTEENQVQDEFAARKQRSLGRWALAEAIERRKLENESGETYAPLPHVVWPDRMSDGAENAKEEDGLAIAYEMEDTDMM